MGNPIKKKPPIKAKDTVHVGTSKGYKIVVKKGSPYDKQAKKTGVVISQTRPGDSSKRTKNNDPLSVKNFDERYGKPTYDGGRSTQKEQ